MSQLIKSMTHMHYNVSKTRMLESAKGFWRVKTIHTLTNRLKQGYNTKDFIILKTIKKPPLKVPSFISFEHTSNRNFRNFENQKNNSSSNLRVDNFFITANQKRLNKINLQKRKEELKVLYRKLFGQFKYEPLMYNNCQFFYLQKEQRLLPRKFKDVVKDCMAFQEYKSHIKYLQNQVYISLSIDINLPLNSPEYPKFYSYVIIRNQKYGLEFSNLSNQVFPQDIMRANNGRILAQQINNIDFDFQQFVYLSGEEKIVRMKLFITKVYFKN